MNTFTPCIHGFHGIVRILRTLLLLILFSTFFNLSSFAQKVELEEARTLAEKAFRHFAGIPSERSIQFSEPLPLKTLKKETAFFVFNEESGGFIILSAEKKTTPVLGYSATGTFLSNPGDWPPAMAAMMDSWTQQIEFLRDRDLPPSREIRRNWTEIEQESFFRFKGSMDVSPLLSTIWNQGCGYNAQCPTDPAGPCSRALTGCVATAMAQVIRYFEHPVTGVGSKCYNHSKYGQLCADFGSAVYDYSVMPNNSGNAEVAKLMYHCGVAVSMNYGPSASGAYSSSVATAMRNFFDYTNGLIIGKGAYTEANWNKLMRNELDNNRPIYYSGYGNAGGHAFVVDGYQPTDHFHLNWGWGGAYNGYFYLNNLNPASYTFNNSQQAIVGMIPTGQFTGLDFGEAIDLLCATPVNGSISLGKDYVNYYQNVWPSAVGKELIYRFSTTLPGRIRIKITNQTGPVQLFLLDHMHKDSLVANGQDGLIVDDMPPGTWYLAAEGVSAAEPDFTIEVICPTMDADLIVFDAEVSPQFVESGQSNVSFSSTVKNIGNTAASSCHIEYYLSANSTLEPGTDILLGSGTVPALSPGENTSISHSLTLPGGLNSGSQMVLFVVDRENTIPESDDENIATSFVTVPAPGLMDCSSSISLEDGVWFHGNTALQGQNLLESYWSANEMTGPEVIHSFIPQHSGLVKITFIEKSPGTMQAIVLPLCNENTYESTLRPISPLDTLMQDFIHAVAGTEYFIVVDGHQGASGDYSLLVELPEECPKPEIQWWGHTDLCEGEAWPNLWTFWGYRNYQWFLDGNPIPGAVNSSYSPDSPGTYHVEVTENGCAGASDLLQIRMDPTPDTARIAGSGDLAFCQGGSVELRLDNSVAYPKQWARNGVLIPGETGDLYLAEEPGIYTLLTQNGACRVPSENYLEVIVNPMPVNIGETIPFPSDQIEFFYPFTADNLDVSGNNYSLTGWEYEPVNDRHGNFWQARKLSGTNQVLYSSHYADIPGEFTLALWFKTNTTEGGLLSGFVNNPWNATQMDAVLYMSDDGKLHFYISNEGSPSELSTSLSYNNDQWHLVVIRHHGIMQMEINAGDELLQSAGPAVKQNFKGYWSFGGPDVPAGASSMPTSKYFSASIDDLTCLNESNPLISPFMTGNPVLEIELLNTLPACDGEVVSFELANSQKGIEYTAWNKTTSAFYGPAETGTGGTISLSGTTGVTQTSEFQIMARNPLTGCEIMLDTSVVFVVSPVETPAIGITADVSGNLCTGAVVNFTATLAHAGTDPEITWYVNGSPQAWNSTAFSHTVPTGALEVFAKLINANPCATANEVFSDTIRFQADVCTLVPEEPEPESQLKIYPNPASEKIHIESSFVILNIRVLNSLGRMVFREQINKENCVIIISGWPEGIYFILIEDEENNVIRRKIVVL